MSILSSKNSKKVHSKAMFLMKHNHFQHICLEEEGPFPRATQPFFKTVNKFAIVKKPFFKEHMMGCSSTHFPHQDKKNYYKTSQHLFSMKIIFLRNIVIKVVQHISFKKNHLFVEHCITISQWVNAYYNVIKICQKAIIFNTCLNLIHHGEDLKKILWWKFVSGNDLHHNQPLCCQIDAHMNDSIINCNAFVMKQFLCKIVIILKI